MRTLPVVDMREFARNPNSPGGRRFTQALRDACHDPGFCYLEGHRVPGRLSAGVMAAAHAFFALPSSARNDIAIAKSPHFRGYTILGDEHTGGRRDWRDQIDIGPEELAEPLNRRPYYRRLRGPNKWPTALPSLRFAAIDWITAMSEVGLTVLRGLAVGLGQPLNRFDEFILPNPYPRLKIIRYPAIDEVAPPRTEGEPVEDQGVGWHHDSGLLTFILQDDVGGLEVDTGNGTIEAVPRAGSLVLNLGEMLQTATNGYLRATKHRVVSPPPGKERISVAFFFNPKLDAVFETLRLPPALAARATGGQNADPTDPVYTTFGENTLKIRLRAHPDVARIHYADYLPPR